MKRETFTFWDLTRLILEVWGHWDELILFFCSIGLFQIRVGLPLLHAYSPEELLYRYGVDLHITAHEHSYERSWPVYNNMVMAFDSCLKM